MGVLRIVSWLLAVAVVAVALIVGGYLKGGEHQPLQCTLIGVGCPEVTLGGWATKQFEPLKRQWEANFKAFDEVGARLVVYRKDILLVISLLINIQNSILDNGEKVVDLLGGKASVEKNTPYNENTLSGIFSSGKNMVHILILSLSRKERDPLTNSHLIGSTSDCCS